MTKITFERDGVEYETANMERATRDERELMKMLIDGARMCGDVYEVGWVVQDRIKDGALRKLINSMLEAKFKGSAEGEDEWQTSTLLITGAWTEYTETGRRFVRFDLNPDVARCIQRYSKDKSTIAWDDLTVAIVNDTHERLMPYLES